MDREALDAGIWQHRVNMARLAASILNSPQDVEDAVSEAVLHAYAAAHTLRDEQRLRPWLLRITARCALDILRKAKHELPCAEVERPEPPVAAGPGSLYEVLLRLPPATRRVLVLYYYEGFKAREIAGILSCPLSTVLMRLSRGRKQLKTMLKEEEE